MKKNNVESFFSPLVAGTTVMEHDSTEVIYRPYGMDAWIINCTSSGSGAINRGAGSFRCVKGDILLFPPRVAHDYTRSGSWVHQWVYFIPRLHWEPWLQWPQAGGGVLRVSIHDTLLWDTISRRMADVAELARSTESDRHDLGMNALEEVLLLCRRGMPDTVFGRIDSRISAALRHIRTNYRTPLSVEELAAVSTLSPSRMAHLFAAQTGLPVRRYLEQYRLTVAQEMLISTDKPIRSIAWECGFTDPLYFSRVFTARTGVSPRGLRKRTVLQ